MAEWEALHIALTLLADPARVRKVQKEELPQGISTLLAVAVGDDNTLASASAHTGHQREALQEAAGFFIEQIMLNHQADSYRILGCSPQATYEELRRNMALLMRWLHPDLQAQRHQPITTIGEIFSARVTQAWNNLKIDTRRRAYDLQRSSESVSAPPAAPHAPPASSVTPAGSHRTSGGSKRMHGASVRRYRLLTIRKLEGDSFWVRLFCRFRRRP